MKKTELVYLPYYVHKAVVRQGDAEYEVVACTDGIEGGFSFFNVEEMTSSDEAPEEVIDFVLSPEEAVRCCRDNLRWHLVRQGLRLKVKARVEEVRGTQRLYYPYWVAYFERGGRYDFRTADGVTGEVQGVRMRSLFLKAFLKDRAVCIACDSPQRTQSVQRQ